MQFIPEFEQNLTTILFFVFAFVALIQLLYVLFIHGKLSFYNDSKKTLRNDYPPVTILISARNDADNIYENLPSILQQDYPIFEVIVINHQSIDESHYILNAYAQQYKNLRVIEIERSHHLKAGKKLPLTIGIKGAQFEHILLTDADCKPATNQWLKSMVGNFTENKEIVLGYAPYIYRKSFLNKIIRFDTTWIAMNYFSLAMAKIPYMGVGRNLAYTKTVFNSVNGFKSHYSLASGDDDLFVQETATRSNFSINLDPVSYCYSEGSEDWESWFRQKARHYTTSSRYKVFKKAMLGIYPLTLLILLISFVILLFDMNYRWITLSVFGLLLFIKWWIHARCFKRLKEPGFIAMIPLLDIAYSILIPILYYSVNKKEDTKW
ncbi:MAG: glycosyltransferase [Flavobacteriia bacterium]|nr:glycosyltransferase [Flavobacteriia bacterium]